MQLADDIVAGMTTRDGIEYRFAQIEIVNENGTVIVTVRALSDGQVQMEVDWHNEEYKNNLEVRRLIKEATNETIMFVLFN